MRIVCRDGSPSPQPLSREGRGARWVSTWRGTPPNFTVMVNAEDLAVRANRLALLQRLVDRLGSAAAIEHLSV